MQFYGKAEEAANKILTAFEVGQIPAALAQVFIHKHDDTPCQKWSWQNQLLVALAGHYDARGFRQWQSVGRSVIKGERALHILAPMVAKVEDSQTGEKVPHVYGFKSVAVFGLDQTDGAPVGEGKDSELYAWLENLPLRQVADGWGLSVSAFSGEGARYYGYYKHRKAIALGVKNLSTWAHEIMHAADDKVQGGLAGSSKIDKEIIAELGGTILLEILGYQTESDRGGCWQYIKRYSDSAKIKPLTAITKVLNRTCQAVALILETAENIQTELAA